MRPGDGLLLRRKQQAGFTLMIALFALTLFGLALAAYGDSWSRQRQREREEDLLRIGHDFVAAIGHYYEKSPGAAHAYPRAIGDLLEDKRFAGYVHHLRDAYRDPMTGDGLWGYVEAPDGGIAGVYSLSDVAPLRRTPIDIGNTKLLAAQHYRDWKFTYLPDAMGNNAATR